MHFDSIVPQIIAQKKNMALAMKRKFRLRRPRRQATPKPLERAYFLDLQLMLKAMLDSVSTYVIPVIDSIRNQASLLKPTVDSYKADDFADLIDDAMRQARIQFLRRYSEGEIAELVRKQAAKIDAFSAAQIDKQFGAVLGIDLTRIEPWLSAEYKTFTRENVSLIKSIPDQFFDKVERSIIKNVRQGALTKDIKAEILKNYDVSESRAALIARDQVGKFNGNLNQLRQTNVGVAKYIWSTSGDERVRDSHASKEGKTFSWNDPPSDTGHPGEDFQCRCSAIPVFDDE